MRETNSSSGDHIMRERKNFAKEQNEDREQNCQPLTFFEEMDLLTRNGKIKNFKRTQRSVVRTHISFSWLLISNFLHFKLS